MYKQIVAYLYKKTLFTDIDMYNNMNESQKCYSARRNSDPKDYILNDSFYVKF